ncbi:MAG TPA: hypothetical protein VFF52_30845 [Isosphaeraceae bacterium]|nr:hypothetical protein [Isosphaeraceae bacterium]
MSTDSQRSVPGIEEVDPDPALDSIPVESDPEVARLLKIRQAEMQRILGQRKPELIQAGIEAYKRDRPRLLAEKRLGQLVAYRGSEVVAFAGTGRRLQKRHAKKGFTDRSELFIAGIAPLDIDEGDEPER